MDNEIQRDVESELKWTPEVDDTDVSIKVQGGAVTLTGFVPDSFQKYRAERAARRVKGVAAVANDIQVRWSGTAPTDPEIARAAVATLKSDLPSAAEQIRPMVHEGRITLLGEVEWYYQRELAEKLMHRIAGVISVRNSIHIKPKLAAEKDIKARIEGRHSNASRTWMPTTSQSMPLDQKSHFEARCDLGRERDQAQATAWGAPGVTRVANELTVRT